jgi:hypothetical protein
MKKVCVVRDQPKWFGFLLSIKTIDDSRKWAESMRDDVVYQQLSKAIEPDCAPRDREVARMMLKSIYLGKLEPYFGPFLSIRTLTYEFRVFQGEIKLDIRNPCIDGSIAMNIQAHEVSSYMPGIRSESLPDVLRHRGTNPWKKRLWKRRQWSFLLIDEKSYQRLTSWEHWNEREALTQRYTYIFGLNSVSMSIHVRDNQSNATKDITMYEDW